MKKLENNSKEMVAVPSSTLNAIKKMMFSKSGIDITNIVNDVCCGEENDLVSINVALAYNGFKPDIDNGLRFSRSWKSYTEHKMVGRSLITGYVRCEYKRFIYNKDTDSFEITEDGEVVMSEYEWDQLEPEQNLEMIIQRIKEA